MEWINMLIGIIGGSTLTALFTIPSTIRRAKSEARSVDLDNLQKAIDGWHQIADERQEVAIQQHERIDQLNNKIDRLYADLTTVRDNLNAELLINNELRIEAAKKDIKLCNKRNCQDRTPPTGY